MWIKTIKPKIIYMRIKTQINDNNNKTLLKIINLKLTEDKNIKQ